MDDLYPGRVAAEAQPSRVDWVRKRKSATIHIVLFVATFLSATLTSATDQGADITARPWQLLWGLPFALSLFSILLSHEFGHYIFARIYGVDASLPYFLPAPFIVPTGTFGAFIRMRGIMPHRRALFDIGAAGPWAGFIVSVPVVMLGLWLSEVRPLSLSEGGLMLGDCMLFSWLTQLILGVDPDTVTVILHPVAMAGWFGLFITMLNLLPAGQLDGGHIASATFGRHARFVARATFVFALVLGVDAAMEGEGWVGWLLWAGILAFLGLDHPPTHDPHTPLDPRRLVMSALTLVMLIITFIPNPIYFAEPAVPPEQREDLIHVRSDRSTQNPALSTFDVPPVPNDGLSAKRSAL